MDSLKSNDVKILQDNHFIKNTCVIYGISAVQIGSWLIETEDYTKRYDRGIFFVNGTQRSEEDMELFMQKVKQFRAIFPL